MNVTYDTRYDLLYIKLSEGTHEVTTQRVNEDIALDFDEAGRLVGIEVLSASEHLDLSRLLPVTTQVMPASTQTA